MSDERAPEDQILNLWPTVVGQAKVPDHQEADEGLLGLADGGALPDNLFDLDDSAVRWLEARVRDAVAAWFNHTESQPPRGWHLRGWLEVIGFCDYRELANDPGAYLSGLYFVHEPEPPDLSDIRSDCEPSRVSFFDPRVGFNAISLEGDPYVSQSITVTPESGMLMIWPGYLRHITRVHLSHRPWVLARFRVELPSRVEPNAAGAIE